MIDFAGEVITPGASIHTDEAGAAVTVRLSLSMRDQGN